MDNKVISTIIEALAIYKENIQELNELIELLKDETKNNQDEIVKTKEVLEKQIEDLTTSTSKMINDVISKIPKEVTIDYGRLEASLKAKVNRYVREKDSDISELRADLKAFIKTIMPKDGIDGIDADNEAILSDLKKHITNNGDFVGERGLSGSNGKDGVDGIGIKDIYEEKDYLYIELTNKDIKKFKIPTKTITKSGGLSQLKTIGGESIVGKGDIPVASAIGSGDIEITDPTKGYILTDTNSNRWRITVDTDGILKTTQII